MDFLCYETPQNSLCNPQSFPSLSANFGQNPRANCMDVLVEIITIGDEILYGQIVDTNSQWMSAEMDKVGLRTIRKTTVADREEDILTAFKEAESRAEVILITGGLGPTNDDLTKPCLARYFDCDMAMHEQAFKDIGEMFKKRGYEFTERNQQQAVLPTCCTYVPNRLGSAPGMRFEREGKLFYSMPGVPFEMKSLMSELIIPQILEHFHPPVIHHRLIKTAGIGESWLADQIKDWETALPDHIKLAYLPSFGQVRLRLTASGKSLGALQTETQEQIDQVVPLIHKHVYGFDEDILESAIGNLCKEQGKTMATAESCTGGLVSHRLTSIPGSSAYFQGAVVAYANEVKMQELGVKEATLRAHGAVSEETVTEMAEGIRKKLGTSIGIATSGIAGPDGGTPAKPVGTIWIACADEAGTRTRLLTLARDRKINVEYTVMAALFMAWQSLSKSAG